MEEKKLPFTGREKIRFNVPPFTGREYEYVRQAVENQKICGDGEFTKKASHWFEEKTGTALRGYRSNLHHVKLPRRLLEADHLINLPILKAHASMVFSCALKNIKGVVQDAVP